MKISLQWLCEYVDIKDYLSKPQELGNLLTAAGIEVESVHNRAKDFEFVVVGHILKKDQHPNADRLTLCQVATGEGVVHQIVCGARNHNEGDRVVVALPGAVLPGNFVIKHSKIRGVESGGMLCSETELGLKSEGEGILLLPQDAPVGAPFAKYMGFDDIIFELKVTPNRADCLSHFGLAREIGCLLGREVKFPVESMTTVGSSQEQMGLELRASDLCPRYAGRGVRGVKVGPSPEWLVKRLEIVDIKPINNVVDITNYVMMELGQPMHAFDVRDLRGRKIIIDRAVKGESFTTLDGTDLTLDGTELTIRDAERPVALAGVIGGKNSGIKDDTVEIFLESAYFTAAGVRRTSRKFGVETDSSYRFARGTNPDAVLLALNRAAQLVQKIASGDSAAEVLGEHHDKYPSPIRHQAIEITHASLEQRLGYSVKPEEFVDWMKRLGCEVANLAGETLAWSVLPPTFRWDLAMDVDLLEEFARLHGYQHIPETLPALATMPASHDLSFVMEAKIRRLLQGEGCLQAINYAFISRSFQDKILGDVERMSNTGLKVIREPVALVNPLNEEINVMRTALVPGLFKNVVHNSHHGNSFGRVFELGFAHFADKAKADSGLYGQEGRLAFAFWGGAEDLWRKTEPAPAVMELRGVIENLLRGMGFSKWRWLQDSVMPEFLHPSQSARLELEGKAVGFIGTLHPVLKDESKIREACALAELNLDILLAGQPRFPRYSPISKFPAVDRDLAFAMPKELAAGEVESEIRKAAGELLREVRVFDVFEGGNLPEGQKSVAFRMVFQAREATLEDQKINEIRDRIVNAVGQKFGVTLRG